VNRSKLSDRELELKSLHYRKEMLRVIKQAGAGHTGGGLSCIDILNVLYNRVLNVSAEAFAQPNRDRYVQSKGHCVEALYVVLCDRGFFPKSELDTVCQYRSHFVGHPTRKVPGVEQNTGALGHGLSFCVGLALAACATALSTPAPTGQPTAVIADTIKGKGVSFMEDMAKWHHGVPNDDEYVRAIAELDAAILRLQGRAA
jgi:transketolase N-terminal domain/subunit